MGKFINSVHHSCCSLVMEASVKVAAKPRVKQSLHRLTASCQMSCVLPMFQRLILLLKDKTPSEQSETHIQTRGLKKLPIEMKVVGTI
jgi:hypothetical protein